MNIFNLIIFILILFSCNNKFTKSHQEIKLNNGSSLIIGLNKEFQQICVEDCTILLDTVGYNFNCYNIDTSIFFLNTTKNLCIGILARKLSESEIITFQSIDKIDTGLLDQYKNNVVELGGNFNFNSFSKSGTNFLETEEYSLNKDTNKYVYLSSMQFVNSNEEIKIQLISYPTTYEELNYIIEIKNEIFSQIEIR